MAKTTQYDVAMCHGLQDGMPLRVDRWDGIQADVLAGERSDPSCTAAGKPSPSTWTRSALSSSTVPRHHPVTRSFNPACRS